MSTDTNPRIETPQSRGPVFQSKLYTGKHADRDYNRDVIALAADGWRPVMVDRGEQPGGPGFWKFFFLGPLAFLGKNKKKSIRVSYEKVY